MSDHWDYVVENVDGKIVETRLSAVEKKIQVTFTFDQLDPDFFRDLQTNGLVGAEVWLEVEKRRA